MSPRRLGQPNTLTSLVDTFPVNIHDVAVIFRRFDSEITDMMRSIDENIAVSNFERKDGIS